MPKEVLGYKVLYGRRTSFPLEEGEEEEEEAEEEEGEGQTEVEG